ncbi:hypothetical protein [Breoghania sp. JC706]|uniref:hypothetical protein n=1 Tax=Breoghania sp. JC706 TaxID=3117732 RepID=UPI00300969A0
MSRKKPFLIRRLKKAVAPILERHDLKVVPSTRLVDFYLYEYESYEQYRDVQTFYNKQKIKNVWADEKTLRLIGEKLAARKPGEKLKGLCHGSRNGFEQSCFIKAFGFDVIGTDISDTATQFDNSVQWDFHDRNEEWVAAFDFVYTNSHDQSWNPRQAFATWLDQLKDDGLLVIEHTNSHGPSEASQMDPFGVRPTVFPYVMCEWFGHSISIEVLKTRKENVDLDAWLFFIAKTPLARMALDTANA